MHPIEKWHKLIKSNDPNKFDELLDENCTFYSPVVFTPIKGREMTKMYLMAAGGVFGEGPSKEDQTKSKPFKYIKEIIDKNSAVLLIKSSYCTVSKFAPRDFNSFSISS